LQLFATLFTITKQIIIIDLTIEIERASRIVHIEASLSTTTTSNTTIHIYAYRYFALDIMNDTSVLLKLFFWTCTDDDDDYYFVVDDNQHQFDDYMHKKIAIPSSVSQPTPLISILKNNNSSNNKKNHAHQHVEFGGVECKQYFRRRGSLEIQTMPNYRATIKTCKQEMYEVDQRAKEWMRHVQSIARDGTLNPHLQELFKKCTLGSLSSTATYDDLQAFISACKEWKIQTKNKACIDIQRVVRGHLARRKTTKEGAGVYQQHWALLEPPRHISMMMMR